MSSRRVAPDTYALWARANPAVEAKLSYKLDGGEWQAVDFHENARGQQNIAADNKPDMRFLAWVKGGHREAQRGQAHDRVEDAQRRRARITAGSIASCLRAFPSCPRAAASRDRGEAARPRRTNGSHCSPMKIRSIRAASLIFRAHPRARGKVRSSRAADGDKLRFAQRRAPVKFWGVGANLDAGRYSREQLTQRAKYLRKFGDQRGAAASRCSMKSRRTEVLDPKKLDEYDWWFAELKKHGIYTGWSVFYHFTVGPEDGYPRSFTPNCRSRADAATPTG